MNYGYMMMVDGGTEYLMEIKTLKNIVVTIVLSLCILNGIKVMRNILFYNAHEVEITELQCFSTLRDLKLPGEIVEYNLSPGIRFGNNKTSIEIRFKQQNFSEREVNNTFLSKNWKVGNDLEGKRIYQKNNVTMIYCKFDSSSYYIQMRYDG